LTLCHLNQFVVVVVVDDDGDSLLHVQIMNFLCQGFQQLSSDRQADRQTDRQTRLKLQQKRTANFLVEG